MIQYAQMYIFYFIFLIVYVPAVLINIDRLWLQKYSEVTHTQQNSAKH